MTYPQAKRTTTVPPEEISAELMPVVEELGLVENCRQLAREGYTIIENVAAPEFVARLRNTILESTTAGETGSGSSMMVLGRDPVYAEAALNPRVMAMAEFSVGRLSARQPNSLDPYPREAGVGIALRPGDVPRTFTGAQHDAHGLLGHG